jgi:5-aminolevulinate synthase
MIAAAALASIWHVRADAARRSALFERAETYKRRLCAAGTPVLPSMSHIVPLPPMPEPDAFAELGGC